MFYANYKCTCNANMRLSLNYVDNCTLLCVNEYDYLEMGFVSPTP